MVSVPARIAQSTSRERRRFRPPRREPPGRAPQGDDSRCICQWLIRARAHGRLALNVYDKHEHAVGCNRHVFGERPLNMLLDPSEHVCRERLSATLR